jgi:hypothetical protein
MKGSFFQLRFGSCSAMANWSWQLVCCHSLHFSQQATGPCCRGLYSSVLQISQLSWQRR